MTDKKLSEVEHIKLNSNYLRGTLVESLKDKLTGAIAPDDTQLTKFHGFYQQDDRELRAERKRAKLEPHYQFMVRLRLPGGVLTPEQWLALDDAAHTHGEGTMRLTTRQTFQFHGILKEQLKPFMQAVDCCGLDSRGGCGDDVRNVIANANPDESALHAEIHDWANQISQHFLWKSRAYDELWLDAPPSDKPDDEPFFGKAYMPRKFKFGLALPPHNDCDVFVNDVGLIAIVEDDELVGFNVAAGGGGGMSHGNTKTYPRLGTVIGYCDKAQVMAVCEKLASIQRDFGDRCDRTHARFKYTIDDRGIDWLVEELTERLGWSLQEQRPYEFTSNGDRLGWVQSDNGNAHATLYVENGRVADFDSGYKLMTGFRELAKVHTGEFRITCNQNIIVANVTPEKREAVQAVIDHYQLDDGRKYSALRHASMACVAFPTCGLAMAESERYLPQLLDKLDNIMIDAGLKDDPIVVRMTGCPNGCARPYLGEIGFTGKAMGKYNVFLGAAFNGDRLNKLYLENVGEETILDTLTPLIHRYAGEREEGERFGNFVVRVGIIAPTTEGRLIHENAGPLESA